MSKRLQGSFRESLKEGWTSGKVCGSTRWARRCADGEWACGNWADSMHVVYACMDTLLTLTTLICQARHPRLCSPLPFLEDYMRR